jgi:hypothetical protein
MGWEKVCSRVALCCDRCNLRVCHLHVVLPLECPGPLVRRPFVNATRDRRARDCARSRATPTGDEPRPRIAL